MSRTQGDLKPSRRRMLGLAVLAAAIVLSTAIGWLTHGSGARDPSESSPALRDSSASASGEENGVPAVSPAAAVLGPVEPLDADEAPQAPAWASLPHAVCTGRVVDESGAPVEAATVSCVPDAWVLEALGFAEESGLVPLWWRPSGPLSAGRIELEQMPSAGSDATGRFEVRIPFIAGHAPAEDRVGERLLPELLVQQGGRVPSRRVCREFGPAGCDVGDIVLPRAAAVVGRTVDEQGRGVGEVDIQILVEGLSLPVAGDPPQMNDLDPGLRFRFARSGGDGRFRMDWLWPGTATFSFDAAARLPAARTGAVLAVGSELDLGDIVLERGPSISGHVIDDAGLPLPGAEVRISVHHFDWRDVEHPIHEELNMVRWGRAGHMDIVGEREGRYGVTRSDGDGRFELGGLEMAEYGVYAVSEGWEPNCVLHVATGSTGVVLQLHPQSRLRVRIVDDTTGAPISDASLHVVRGTGKWFSERGAPLSALVDDAAGPGVFLVDQVCPAPMAAVIESGSHGRQIVAFDGLPLGAAPEERELRVSLGSAVSGRVLDAAGIALVGARVRLSPYDYDQALGLLPRELTAESGADGRFEFAGLTPAHWSLSAGLDGYGSLARADVWLASGEDLQDVDLVLVRLGHVAGSVTQPDGTPAKQLMVAAKEDPASAMAEAVTHTGDDGRYALNVRPGTYSVEVVLANASAKFRELIEVASDQTVRVDFALPSPARLSGRVLAGGSPSIGARVHLRGKGLSLQTETDAEGEYRLEWPAGGDGELWARSTRGGLTLKEAVRVEAGQSVLLDLQFGALTLDGTIVDAATGQAVPDAGIAFSMKGGAGNESPRAVSDAEGRFSIRDIAAGRWLCLATHERYLSTEWIAVEIGAADDPATVRIEMTRGATLRGVVRTPSGSATAQVLQVSVRRDSEDGGATHSADTESGAYELTNLQPGRYTVLVGRASELWDGLDPERAEQLADARATIQLQAGQEVVLDLMLPTGER